MAVLMVLGAVPCTVCEVDIKQFLFGCKGGCCLGMVGCAVYSTAP